jgi:glutathione synthase/RimK-type ligase-like ATP-grasp enzyme
VTSRVRVATTLRVSYPDLRTEENGIVDALRAVGLNPELVAWYEIDPAPGGTPILVRTTWDYPEYVDDFRDWLTALESSQIPVLNPVPLIRWNLTKQYLFDLARYGAAIVPSDFIPANAYVPASDHDRVLKPVIGVGSLGAQLVKAGSGVTAECDSILSPFITGVYDGERSVFVVDGEVVYCVRKTPASSDWRVQPQYGGRYEIEPAPPAEVVAAALDAFEAARRAIGDIGYLRVDLLRSDDSRWRVLEAEAIEPSLYCAQSPVVANAVAALVRRRWF